MSRATDTPRERTATEFDGDAVAPQIVARRLVARAHRAESILMLLIQAGIPLGYQTHEALEAVREAIGETMDLDGEDEC